MKVELRKEQILPALISAEKISGKNLTLPVLNGVLIVAQKNNILVRATNLDIGIEIKVAAKVSEEGSVVVPGGVLANTITAVKSGKNIELSLTNDNLIVSSDGVKTVIKALPSEDFPTLPKVEGGESFEIDPAILSKGFRAVWYSASISSIKPELASVYLFTQNSKLVFVATDSFRLAEKNITLKKTSDFEPLLIPIRNVSEILRIMESANEDVVVSYTKDQISFSFAGVYVTSRLVDGTYPDYKAIIPKNFTTEVTLLRQDFMDILKKTGIFANKFNQVYFHIHPKKQSFVIKAENADVGETTETVSSTVTGEDIEISFNQKYITDVFQSLPTDSITLSFSGLGKPMVVQGVGDTSFLYLVMPMNR